MDEPNPPLDQKPESATGYPSNAADLCERTLVTLLRGLGPWKHSIVLVGGLVPRYLIDQRASDVSQAPHVGTLDIDLVIEIGVLAETEAYYRLEQNLKGLGFERTSNDEGNPRHFQWRKRSDDSGTVVVDLLQDADLTAGGKSVPIPGERRLSALGIPGAGLALQDFIEVPVTARLLDERGVATETIRVCGIVPFMVLKLRAYDDRFEPKDAYDIVYCLMDYPGGPATVGKLYAERATGLPDNPYLLEAVAVLRNRFVSSDDIEGYEKDGPASYSRFLAFPGSETSDLLNRQNASAVAELFVYAFDQAMTFQESQ